MDLIKHINQLRENRELWRLIQKRIREFESNKKYFSELCFCTLTAGASAASGIKCQKALGNKFQSIGEKQLQKELKRLGYRFHNRASYIAENQKNCGLLGKIKAMPSKEAREFLMKNFKGIGMKEASHFLRNIGRKDVAIIDRHILRSMGFNADSLNKKKYLKIEEKLRKISSKERINLAELDLLLWFGQTGKVLK